MKSRISGFDQLQPVVKGRPISELGEIQFYGDPSWSKSEEATMAKKTKGGKGKKKPC